MENENKSGDKTEENKLSIMRKLAIYRRGSFPPELSKFGLGIKYFILFIIPLLLIYITGQFCKLKTISWLSTHFLLLSEIFAPCVCCTYIALGILALLIAALIIIYHKLKVHEARLVDFSEVKSLFVEADTIETRLVDSEIMPKNHETKEKQVKEEVKRLKKIGSYSWTEYQVLSLNQLLVDFQNPDELIARTRSNIVDLKEYAEISTTRYDREYCNELEKSVNDLIEKISELQNKPVEQEKVSEKLRAGLRTMLEDIANYDYLWAEGSAIISSIRKCGVIAIFPLIMMGLLPILHPSGNEIMGILNWGLFGITGAITSVLWSLHKSDFVDVGSREGKKELWRALLGGGLGFVAGILLYSMISGEILSGDIFPKLNEKPDKVNIARSIFWGIFSGFSLEFVFDRLRSASDGSS